MAESLTLAEKAGIDSSVALTLLNGQSSQKFPRSVISMFRVLQISSLPQCAHLC